MTRNPSSINGQLSQREIEVLREVASGASNRQIAGRLHISTNTVKVHLSNIYSKLGVTSRTEATLYAIQAGWVEGVEANAIPVQPRWWRRWWVLAAGGLVVVALAVLVGFLVRPRLLPGENIIDIEVLERERWRELAPMPTARRGIAVAAYNGMIYVIGGETESGVTGVVERYDPETDSWETLPSKPTAVADVQAAVVGGRIYVPGGRLPSGAVTNIVEVFDLEQERWKSLFPLPYGISEYALAVFESRMFLFGGWDGEQSINAVLEYDPEIDEWLPRLAMRTALSKVSAATTSRGILLIGGVSGVKGDAQNTLLEISRSSDEYQWIDASPLPDPGYGNGAASLADIVHVVGDRRAGADCRMFKYFITRNEWECHTTPLAANYQDFALISQGTDLYILGGKEEDDFSSNVYAYQAIFSIVIPVLK
jgi:DNA-binding CsgD family transcriptional regulator